MSAETEGGRGGSEKGLRDAAAVVAAGGAGIWVVESALFSLEFRV